MARVSPYRMAASAYRIMGLVRHLPNFIRLVWRLAVDPRVPLLPKAILAGAVLYMVSPYDVLADIIPFAGQVDDLALLFVAVRAFIGLCPPRVVR